MLKGIDVSSHNGWPFIGRTEHAYNESDFVILKGTEGTGYVNPFCNAAYQRAKSDGKLLGFYHYARGASATAEADYFYNHCKHYFGEAIPVLDWEAGTNREWGNGAWVTAFCVHLHDISGIWPMIYVQASALRQCSGVADKCALWIAGYPNPRIDSWAAPTRMPYSTSPWSTWTLWQYTSAGGLDRNIGQLTREGWLAIAGASTKSSGQWIKDAKGWWYRRADGSYPKYQSEKIGDYWYAFDSEGYLRIGWWRNAAGQWWYSDAKGVLAVGWVQYGGKLYWIDGNRGMSTGYDVIDGKGYLFDKVNGDMVVNGFVHREDDVWYLVKDGVVVARLKRTDTGIDLL